MNYLLDRMLITQAICEDVKIITCDSKFEKYPIGILRA